MAIIETAAWTYVLGIAIPFALAFLFLILGVFVPAPRPYRPSKAEIANRDRLDREAAERKAESDRQKKAYYEMWELQGLPSAIEHLKGDLHDGAPVKLMRQIGFANCYNNGAIYKGNDPDTNLPWLPADKAKWDEALAAFHADVRTQIATKQARLAELRHAKWLADNAQRTAAGLSPLPALPTAN